MTIRKTGRSVKDGHDRKRGVVGDSSELRNDRPGRQATAFQQLEGLRSRRSENGRIGGRDRGAFAIAATPDRVTAIRSTATPVMTRSPSPSTSGMRRIPFTPTYRSSIPRSGCVTL